VTLVVVLALRGAAAVAIVTTLVGGIPRVVQAALAVSLGLWTALLVAPLDATVVGIPWLLAAHELVIGATLGILAAPGARRVRTRRCSACSPRPCSSASTAMSRWSKRSPRAT
jgi:hypothetical protein